MPTVVMAPMMVPTVMVASVVAMSPMMRAAGLCRLSPQQTQASHSHNSRNQEAFHFIPFQPFVGQLEFSSTWRTKESECTRCANRQKMPIPARSLRFKEISPWRPCRCAIKPMSPRHLLRNNSYNRTRKPAFAIRTKKASPGKTEVVSWT